MFRKIMLLLICFMISSLSFAQINVSEFSLSDVSRNGMTKAQAEKLLIIALKYEKYNFSIPGAFVDGDLQDKQGNAPHPGYYDFSVGYDTSKAGAIEYWGLFSVSPSTGDIWEINECERISFPELKNIQTEIMKKTGVTFSNEKVQRRGLGCTDE
ncbi:hypothetical protein [Citrobacter farmeri]|uniref:hypothetical protein n=1 Tax=Citrobacter farmeri TaxID=67824 RepID=UPI0018984E34|nr:hypothetical protein [Citrobacter farmeri]EKU0082314.1 hypothetical protein [Citrobacter farmeri]MDB2171536.1 hypothetical protein [Citrobacter farmeri]MDZ7531673.1 hypothetical protein [Citrobacter farmeri]HCD2003019.1 hypothetical protein [Citrobacter farmeri]HED3140240.1 hypothetical protein [Citrobacter farmeri]